jgi:hypothetical protein
MNHTGSERAWAACCTCRYLRGRLLSQSTCKIPNFGRAGKGTRLGGHRCVAFSLAPLHRSHRIRKRSRELLLTPLINRHPNERIGKRGQPLPACVEINAPALVLRCAPCLTPTGPPQIMMAKTKSWVLFSWCRSGSWKLSSPRLPEPFPSLGLRRPSILSDRSLQLVASSPVRSFYLPCAALVREGLAQSIQGESEWSLKTAGR